MEPIEIRAGWVPGAIGRVVELHGRYYSRHWKLDGRFEAEVAHELGAFMGRCDPARDGFWTALQGEAVLGAIAMDGGGGELGAAGGGAPEDAVRLRWFILDEACQAQGTGRRLLREAMDFSVRAGYRRVFLWTMDGLAAARRLYDDWGFRETERFADTDWGDAVVHLRLEKALAPPGR